MLLQILLRQQQQEEDGMMEQETDDETKDGSRTEQLDQARLSPV